MTELSAAAEPTFPDFEHFGQLVAPKAPRHRAVKQLYELLRSARADAALEERVLFVTKLGAFLRSTRQAPALDGPFEDASPPVQRFELLVRSLELVPIARERLTALLAGILSDSVEGGLFSRIGLPTDRGFFAETVDRISRRFLPEPSDPRDLLVLLSQLVPTRAALRTLSLVPPELLARLIRELDDPERRTGPFAPLSAHLLDAVALLPMRISATGLSDALRSRSPMTRSEASPFYRLPRTVDALLAALERERSSSSGWPGASDGVERAAAACRAEISECRGVLLTVVQNLEQFGVSVDVVYRLELIQRNLDRLASLLGPIEPAAAVERATRIRALVVELAGARLQDRELGDIVRDNLHLLARKIIERAGHTGEHYITATRAEYLKMLLSAGGGGILTAGTAALKFMIGSAHFAPFVEGLFSATNYAGSFIVMQLLGFTLATKQPSMTAAALAGTLRETASHPDLTKLVDLIARIVRSQLAAALGNIGLVIPAALFLDLAWRAHSGAAFLSPESAAYVLHSLHPTESGTLFYGALTGVLLWLSSLSAGWVENWAVYRGLPEAIRDHRLGRIFGRRLFAALSRFVSRNIAGFGGNTALGSLLGMTPVMGKFLGLPLDVRHVTLSTGALTLSVSALAPNGGLTTQEVLPAAIGIIAIGALNFGVSFVLALAVALRARGVERPDRLRLLLSVVATFLRSPLQFLFPPASAERARVHGPVSVIPKAP